MIGIVTNGDDRIPSVLKSLGLNRANPKSNPSNLKITTPDLNIHRHPPVPSPNINILSFVKNLLPRRERQTLPRDVQGRRNPPPRTTQQMEPRAYTDFRARGEMISERMFLGAREGGLGMRSFFGPGGRRVPLPDGDLRVCE